MKKLVCLEKELKFSGDLFSIFCAKYASFCLSVALSINEFSPGFLLSTDKFGKRAVYEI